MVERKIVLAGDVGGTKTRIGLFEIGPEGARTIAEQSFGEARNMGVWTKSSPDSWQLARWTAGPRVSGWPGR